MKIDVDFTGAESPAEIVKAAIDAFANSPVPASCKCVIFYEHSIPKMRYEIQGSTLEFSCVYRLDIMLEEFYLEAEKIFDDMANLGFVNPSYREVMVRYVAFTGMCSMLGRLVILQAQVFGDNFEEVRVTPMTRRLMECGNLLPLS